MLTILLEVYRVLGLQNPRFVKSWDGSIYMEMPDRMYGRGGPLGPPSPGRRTYEVSDRPGKNGLYTIQMRSWIEGAQIVMPMHQRVEIPEAVKNQLLQCNAV